MVTSRALRHSVRVLAVAAAAGMPLANLAANYKDADRSGDTADARFHRSVQRQLPDNAAIVAENYGYDMRLRYLQLTGEGAPERGLGPIGFAAEAVHDAAAGRPACVRVCGRRHVSWRGGAALRACAACGAIARRVGERAAARHRHRRRRRLYAASSRALRNRSPGSAGSGQPRSFSALVRMVGHSDARARRGRRRHLAGRGARHARGTSACFSRDGPRVGRRARRARRASRGARLPMPRRVSRLPCSARTGRSPARSRCSATNPFESRSRSALYELEGENACVDVGTDRWSDVTPALSHGQLGGDAACDRIGGHRHGHCRFTRAAIAHESSARQRRRSSDRPGSRRRWHRGALNRTDTSPRGTAGVPAGVRSSSGGRARPPEARRGPFVRAGMRTGDVPVVRGWRAARRFSDPTSSRRPTSVLAGETRSRPPPAACGAGRIAPRCCCRFKAVTTIACSSISRARRGPGSTSRSTTTRSVPARSALVFRARSRCHAVPYGTARTR